MPRSERVYVVIGRLGEYSDAREWCVRAFRSEAAAESFASAAGEYMADLAKDDDLRDRAWDVLSDHDASRLTKYDTTLAYTIDTGPNAGKTAACGWHYCSEAPTYTVVTCAFEDA